MNTNDVEAMTQKLLNGGDFDVGLLDQIVGAAYDPVSPHRAASNKALMRLQEAPDIWKAADSIIEKAQNPQSRFFGVQVLDDAIKTRYVTAVVNRVCCNDSKAHFTTTFNLVHKDGKFYLRSNGKA